MSQLVSFRDQTHRSDQVYQGPIKIDFDSDPILDKDSLLGLDWRESPLHILESHQHNQNTWQTLHGGKMKKFCTAQNNWYKTIAIQLLT